MKFRIWDGDSENWDEKDHLGSHPLLGTVGVGERLGSHPLSGK